MTEVVAQTMEVSQLMLKKGKNANMGGDSGQIIQVMKNRVGGTVCICN